MAKQAKAAVAKRKNIARNARMTLALFSMMLPGLIYLIINNYIPMAGLVIAFKRFDYSKGIWGSDWAGLSNFTYLFKTNDAFNIIRNTIGYNFVFIMLGTVVAVSVAIMLNFLRGTMNKKIYQTVILIPYLISMVVVSYIVFGFLSQENGYLNKIIASMGGKPISWYTTSKYWPVILTVVNLWKGFGYSSILYYATVIGIDSSLYEAATVDGANRWKQVWHVTLPGLRGTIITMTLLNLGRMFYSDFGLFYQVPMRSGMISSVTDTIDVFVYKGLTQLNDIGRSSAAGFLQSVLGFILVLAANAIVRKNDEENALF
ncbi:ABC transporter permease [Parablautia muri]|uniref:Sugar ABC transporter permease n=1 Tax=Parablautia muri TaxID=2320879 RepID=A0A9X5BGQ2_9FIRM|nr:ABC transporter permease subunit [Parablautia muri]NBJ92662.1 sugar ABC transporter permease [Parablautia muri]